MSSYFNLTEGPILAKLWKVAVPVIASSLVAMLFNITDMFWLGNVGSKAVAAVGVAHFVTWFTTAILSFTKIGAEVNIAQSIGAGRLDRATKYAQNAITTAFLGSTLLAIVSFIFAEVFISFFDFKEADVVADAVMYLRICCLFFILSITNLAMNGVYNGIGKTKIPFVINSIGLVANIILDPVCIYLLDLKVMGAAIATVTAAGISTVLYIYFIKRVHPPFKDFVFRAPLSTYYIKNLINVGAPMALHSAAFSIISMCMAKLVTPFGATAYAVQSLGAQIESLSWMTASGFSTALASFVGQNFGAGKIDRVVEGYKKAVLLSCFFGLIATLLFFFGGELIYTIFMPEAEAIRLGTIYLAIMSYSQIFMCVEITTEGAFAGIGKTSIPSFVGISFTAARLPLAMVLLIPFALNGVWWSITITSWLKGIVLCTWFYYLYKTDGIRKLYLKKFSDV